jgi:2-hydroxy-3-keto-5-methylthiopentenyl-1-phosphate phosphatase
MKEKYKTVLKQNGKYIQVVYCGFSHSDAIAAKNAANDTIFRMRELIKEVPYKDRKNVNIDPITIEIINVTEEARMERERAVELQDQSDYESEEEFFNRGF